MPKVKPKSLGEQLFEIVEAERAQRDHGDVPWSDLSRKIKKRYETIATRFAERIKQEEPTSSPEPLRVRELPA